MSDNPQTPLTEQILKQTLKSLAEHEEFDTRTIRALENLMKSGDVAKPQQVAVAIKTLRERPNEIT